MFNGLLRFPPGSADPARIEPDLAESVAASPDGLSWTFRLRDGIAIQNGLGVLTSNDVVQSLRRAADPKRSSYAGDFADLDSIEALDPRTVRLVLRRPVPSLPGLVANSRGGLIVPAAAAERADFATAPLGTGLFTFARIEPGSTILLAHPGYFRGTPKFAGMNVRYINSDQTRELALITGELDLAIGRRDQRWVERMRGEKGLLVDVFTPGEFRTLLLNTHSKPLDDPRVRQAFEHAIDAMRIAQFVGLDVAKPGRSPVPPGYLGATDDLPTYAPDPARARALLAEAGYPNGITLKAIVSSISPQLSVMEVIQAQLRRAGISLEMDVVDHATYHARIRQDLSQVVFYGAARFPVADSYLTQMYHSRSAPGQPAASLNFSHCDVADTEIDAARSETDPVHRAALWATAQRKIMTAACAVPLFDLLQVWARTSRLDYGYALEGSLNLAPPITEATTLRAP
jgi:peptide/nickel transport system substrate-binding protein